MNFKVIYSLRYMGTAIKKYETEIQAEEEADVYISLSNFIKENLGFDVELIKVMPSETEAGALDDMSKTMGNLKRLLKEFKEMEKGGPENFDPHLMLKRTGELAENFSNLNKHLREII